MAENKGIIRQNVQSDVTGRQDTLTNLQDTPPNQPKQPPTCYPQPFTSRDPRLRSLITPNKTGVKGKPSPARANQGRALTNQKLEISINI